MSKKVFIFFLFLFFSTTVLTEKITVASFNTLRLGQSKKDYKTLAKILSKFDLIGLQEIMNESSLKRLKKTLEKQTKEEWEYHLSEKPVGSSNYKEYYAYIWRKSKINLDKEIGFYESNAKNEFVRPPYGVRFVSNKFDFILVLCHSTHGNDERNRVLEGTQYYKVYEYFKNKSEEDVILAGDFNLQADDFAFSKLKNDFGVIYLINPKVNLTTISKNGLVNSYDNIFINKDKTYEYTGRYGVYDFTNNNHSLIKKWISDHLVVFAEFENNILQ